MQLSVRGVASDLVIYSEHLLPPAANRLRLHCAISLSYKRQMLYAGHRPAFWRNPRGAVRQSLDCEGHAEAVSPTQTVSLGSPASKVMPRTSACRYTSAMR